MAKPKMSEILELSVAERIQLVQDIWDTIAALPESLELSDVQKEEIDRRLDKLRVDPESGVSWEKLRERIGL